MSDKTWTLELIVQLKEAFENGGIRAARFAFPYRTDASLLNCTKRLGIKYVNRKENMVQFEHLSPSYHTVEVASRRSDRKPHAPYACADCGAKDFTLPFAGTKVRKCRDLRACANRVAGKNGRAYARLRIKRDRSGQSSVALQLERT